MKIPSVFPLPFNRILVTKDYLLWFFNDAYAKGAGSTQTLLESSKTVTDSMEMVLKENNKLKAELNRVSVLIDQTQKDAYQLGLQHGKSGDYE